jgi:CRP-like cAMP-binding protein
VNSLANAMSAVLSAPEVSRLSSLRRSTSLFSQDQAADSVYLIEEGLVKLTRVNRRGDRIILTIRGPQELVGEEALAETRPTYYTEAEVLTPATIFRVPRGVLHRALLSSSELTTEVVNYLVERRLALAEKVELLCLHDVEYRILHYLAELASLVKPVQDGDGFQIPITQLELADLIGATRETTSTTLNQLERRGLVKLSRRMLTVPSPHAVRGAAMAKSEHETIATGSSA